MSTALRPRWPSGDSHLLGTPIIIALALFPAASSAQTALFRRGDADQNGAFEVTDAIFTLEMLFLSGPSAGCDDSADVNDDGRLNLTDPIWSLR